MLVATKVNPIIEIVVFKARKKLFAHHNPRALTSTDTMNVPNMRGSHNVCLLAEYEAQADDLLR